MIHEEMKKNGYYTKDMEKKTYEMNVLYKLRYPCFLVNYIFNLNFILF